MPPSVNLLLMKAAASIKTSGDETGWERTKAVDGDESGASHWSGTPLASGVADMWFAADLGVLALEREVDAYRIFTDTSGTAGTDSPQNIATQARLYSTNDDAKWAALTHGSGKMTADPVVDLGWTLRATSTGALTAPRDSGRVPFIGVTDRYWLFKAIAGGTSEWDVNEFELWANFLTGTSQKAARCDHNHRVEHLKTNETDPALVLAPDGSGGVEWVDTSLGWFVVTDYGAVGDGTTDDTAAINTAIAAYNAAGGGVLYFPNGHYKATAGLTSLTAGGLILGDGHAAHDGTTQAVSRISCTSATASLFTVAAHAVTFRGLALVNTAGSTPSAGAGISVTSGELGQYESLSVRGFWIDVDIQDGRLWVMHACFLTSPVKYGLKIRHADLTDEGDWSISDSAFYTDAHAADAAIRIESGGGGKIVNCKINRLVPGTAYFNRGIDLAIGADSSVLLIANNSLENLREDGIHIESTGSRYDLITIAGNEISLYRSTASTAKAVNLVAATLGKISHVAITGNNFSAAAASTAAAISLTKINNVLVAGNLNANVSAGAAPYPFASMLATSGCTDVFDYSTPVTAADLTAHTGDTSDAHDASAVSIVDAGGYFGGTDAEAALQELGADVAGLGPGITDHAHVVDELFSGDAATTVFILANEARPDSVMAWVSGVRTPVTLGGTFNDEITFGSAPAAAADNISVDYAAAVS